MNMKELFQMQAALDAHIIEKKGLAGQDLLPNTILALQVELAELANEWRGFKHWSNNQQPNTKASVSCKYEEADHFIGEGGRDGKGAPMKTYNPLLVEFADCLHFALSIGLQAGHDKDFDRDYENEAWIRHLSPPPTDKASVTRQLIKLMELAADFHNYTTRDNYMQLMVNLLRLGQMLGFTKEQIKTAYSAKHAVNLLRQEVGF